MRNLLTTTFSLIFLFLEVNGKIKIVSPPDFVKWVDGHSGYLDEYALADFGYIPYGRTLYGEVQIADPHTACSPLTNQESSNSFEGHSIVVADRGGCHYVTKTQNAQLAGANLLIVVDNKIDTDYSTYVMSDDGHGLEINIPTILVHMKFGEKIREFAATNQSVTISVTFDDPPQNDQVDLEIWLTNTNNASIIFLQEIKPWIEKIYDQLSFKPHYPIYNSTDPKDPNCVANGKYCSPDPDGDGPLTGQDIIREDLRQLALFYGWSPFDWWTYVTSIDPSCVATIKMHDCAMNIITNQMRIGIREFITKQLLLSGSNPNDNDLLAKEAAAKRSHISSPGVVINGMTYRGNVEPVSHVFAAICEGFSESPESCETYKESTKSVPIIHRKRSVKYILAICIVGLIFFAFFLFCCYKRYLKKQIAKELSLKANTAVSEYFAMHEAGEKDTKGLIEMKASA